MIDSDRQFTRGSCYSRRYAYILFVSNHLIDFLEMLIAVSFAAIIGKKNRRDSPALSETNSLSLIERIEWSTEAHASI